jgi:hypothetical protein
VRLSHFHTTRRHILKDHNQILFYFCRIEKQYDWLESEISWFDSGWGGGGEGGHAGIASESETYLKRSGREADHIFPSSVQSNDAWNRISRLCTFMSHGA